MANGFNSTDITVLERDKEQSNTATGSQQRIDISQWPNGTSEEIELEVPQDSTVSSMSLAVSPKPLPRVEELGWSGISDFIASGVTFDDIDYNDTGIKVLPRGAEWDFETGAFTSDWTTSGSASWFVQSNNRLSGIYTPESGNIADGQTSSLQLAVNNIPGTGSFRYQVSSESSWDYLVFCIDNPSCTRTSGYSSRWSGVTSGTHQFTIPTGSHTYTWKYAKDGSISSYSDTAWIDDVEIAPSGGAGSGGYANWTSNSFGPNQNSTFTSLPGPYGLISFSADVPSDSIMNWTIIDAITLAPITGFLGRTELVADLGVINWEKHPELKLKISMMQGNSGSPVVYGINLQGRWVDEFSSDPSANDWSWTSGSWTYGGNGNGRLSGSAATVIESPLMHVVRPISRLKTDMMSSGLQLEAKLDHGTWFSLGTQALQELDSQSQSVKFRFTSSSGSWSLDRFMVDLQGSGLPSEFRFDVGIDGWYEWDLSKPELGWWGSQSRLGNGELSHQMSFSTPALRNLGLYIPTSGIDSFGYQL